MTAPTDATQLASLSLIAEEAVRFPETVTIEHIRALGEFASTVLSRGSDRVDGTIDGNRSDR